MSEESKHVNRHVGENVRKQREARGWSQSELARRMKDEGWQKYSQMTVSRTEDATRALRLDEAAVLARVLGVPLESLLVPPQQLDVIRELEKVTRELQFEFDNLVGAVQGLIGQRAVLHAYLRTPPVREETSDLGVKLRDRASEALEKCTWEEAVRTGIWREEQDQLGEDQADEILQDFGSMEEYMKDITGYHEDE